MYIDTTNVLGTLGRNLTYNQNYLGCLIWTFSPIQCVIIDMPEAILHKPLQFAIHSTIVQLWTKVLMHVYNQW